MASCRTPRSVRRSKARVPDGARLAVAGRSPLGNTLLTAMGVEGTLASLRASGSDLLAVAALEPATRRDAYSSMASSSSALLGFALAAVAILAALSPRPTSASSAAIHERKMVLARLTLMKCLLSSSLLLAVLLVCATVGIALDSRRQGQFRTRRCCPLCGCGKSGRATRRLCRVGARRCRTNGTVADWAIHSQNCGAPNHGSRRRPVVYLTPRQHMHALM